MMFRVLDKFPSSGEGRKMSTLLGTIERGNLNHRTHPSSFMKMQGMILLTLSRISFAGGNGRYWNISHTHPITVRAIMFSSPK
jgi:hypothetical protein